MPDSVVIAGSTFLPLISYRFRTELDRNFDRWRLLVLIYRDSTIFLSECFFKHLLCGGSGSFSPMVVDLDRVSLSAYSDGGVAARF
ncbi:MAG: hypothetical protein HOB38_18890 [Deltaproteobacteria bacterium]|nr:hypothetical protein [Deltaproteobacteria bacterium]